MDNTIGKQDTFWNLIKEYKIVVPKIQRDYVQGRENDTVKKNRKEFVKELIDSLIGNKPMSLNFVYGTLQNSNEFIPIDGQQRLTTLFLLHLYVFAKKGNKDEIEVLQKKFSYQTRYTTNRFLEKLSEELPEMLNPSDRNDNLTDIIRDSGWYVTPWDNDPNIRSCLVMLQTIHETCNKKLGDKKDGINEFFNLLIGIDCPITFMWLQLDKSFGSDNQLYIRMNSRGKQLTDFENFKAELYEKVLTDKDMGTESLKKNIDGDWYSLLWDANVVESNVKDDKKIDIEKEARLIDSLLKRLIHWTIVSKACVKGCITLKKRGINKNEPAKDKEVVKQKEKHDNLYHYCMPEWNEKIDILRCGVEEYKKLIGKEIKECIIKDLNSLLTFLTSLKDTKVFQYIIKDVLSISDNKGQNIYNIDSYSSRVLLYAITKFAQDYNDAKDKIIEAFKSWYRIVLNLVSTQEIDSPEDFQKAVRAIDEWNNKTAEWLKNEKVEGAFRSAQVKEENLKLSLMDKNGWECAIRNAENTNFEGDY